MCSHCWRWGEHRKKRNCTRSGKQQGTDPTTSALLGGALNATVSNRVEKLFGVGSVKIDPAFVGTLGQSSARITVQEQLSRQITVTFATNVNYFGATIDSSAV